MKKHRIFQALALLLTAAVLITIAACGGNPTNGPNGSDYTDYTNGDTTDLTLPVDNQQILWRVEIRGVPGVTQFTNVDASVLPEVEVTMPVTTAQGFTATHTFRGVSLRAMLGYLGVHNVHNVMVSSVDGTNVNLDRDLAMHEHTILAWEQNGSPINTEPPLRLAPGAGTEQQHVRLVSAITVAVDTTPPTTLPLITTEPPELTTLPTQPGQNTTAPPPLTTGGGIEETTTTTTTTTRTTTAWWQNPPPNVPTFTTTRPTTTVGGGAGGNRPTSPPGPAGTTTAPPVFGVQGGNNQSMQRGSQRQFLAINIPTGATVTWGIYQGTGITLSGTTGTSIVVTAGEIGGFVVLEARVPNRDPVRVTINIT